MKEWTEEARKVLGMPEATLRTVGELLAYLAGVDPATPITCNAEPVKVRPVSVWPIRDKVDRRFAWGEDKILSYMSLAFEEGKDEDTEDDISF